MNTKTKTPATSPPQAEIKGAQHVLKNYQLSDLEQMRLEKSDDQIKEQLFEDAYVEIRASARYRLRFYNYLSYEDYQELELDAIGRAWEYLSNKNLDDFRDFSHMMASLKKRASGAIVDSIRKASKNSEVIEYTDTEIAEGVDLVTPEDWLAAKQLVQVLQRMDLSERERFVLENVLLGGMPQVSAANALGGWPDLTGPF